MTTSSPDVSFFYSKVCKGFFLQKIFIFSFWDFFSLDSSQNSGGENTILIIYKV